MFGIFFSYIYFKVYYILKNIIAIKFSFGTNYEIKNNDESKLS